MFSSKHILTGLALLALAAGPVAAQQFVYPAKGQSKAQQTEDEGNCLVWAKQQSGFDPTHAYTGGQSGQQQGGGVGRTAGRGAAAGAIVGAIAGDAGKGAAIGAASGALVGGVRRQDRLARQQQAQQQQQQQLAQQQANFNRAYAVCLEGRGYTVR